MPLSVATSPRDGNKRSLKFKKNKRKIGRPYRFYEIAYKHVRSAVERFFAWLKSFRRIRYERLASMFLAFVHVACIIMYLRFLQ